MMKGIWAKRELSQKELLETYKSHYRFCFGREYMLIHEHIPSISNNNELNFFQKMKHFSPGG